MHCSTSLSILVAAFSGYVIAESDPVVSLVAGTVTGSICQDNPSTNVYQGIPFAEPPVGDLRFLASREYQGPYPGGNLNANKPPPSCIQWGGPFDVSIPTPSEDCLYLNVYVPHTATAQTRLPVKVWAFGGGNIGSALTFPLYDACNLADDTIVVTFNYRQGPLGFFGLASAGIDGNQAIHDYLNVLRWVQKNIEYFGGDKNKVLLFGQSSGADNAFVVASMAEAKSLISAVALQSGGGYDLTPYDLAQLSGKSFAETLKCSSSDLQCLQKKSVEDLQSAFQSDLVIQPGYGNNLSISSYINVPNITSLDGAFVDGKLIKKQPLKAGLLVPTIAGNTAQDSSLFVLPQYVQDFDNLTAQNYTDFLAEWGPVADAVGKEYPLSLFNQSGSTPAAVVGAIEHIVTVTGYTCAAYKNLRAARLVRSPAWGYFFNHTPHCPWLIFDGQPFPGQYASDYGAAHTAEIPFLFANTENQPFGNGSCNFTPDEVNMSEKLVTAWTSFADRGDPSTKQQSWPSFKNVQDPRGLNIGNSAIQKETLDFSECQFWDKIFAELGGVGFAWPPKGRKPSGHCKPSKHSSN